VYCIRGELLIKPTPESLIGQYGVQYNFSSQTSNSFGETFTEERHSQVLGSSKHAVSALAYLLKRRGKIPENTSIEHIDSLEQADNFAIPSRKRLHVSKFRMPDTQTVLSAQVPNDAELLEGEAQLWKERRMPTPYIYFASIGKLLAEVVYDSEQGWQDKSYRVEGSSFERGIITPLLSYAWRDTEISHYKAR
jgi:hypothetical protein